MKTILTILALTASPAVASPDAADTADKPKVSAQEKIHKKVERAQKAAQKAQERAQKAAQKAEIARKRVEIAIQIEKLEAGL